MDWGNLFSFKGEIGRAQMWLIWIALNVVAGALAIFPVSSHKVVLNTFAGFGESWIGYATPINPESIQNWFLLAIFYLILISLFWVAAAAMVKRLHDLGKSGKWVAYFAIALAISTALQAILSNLGNLISGIIGLVFLAPLSFIGAWGMLMMLFVAGHKNRTAVLSSN